MKITSAKFIKSIVGPDQFLDSGIPQIAFIGRSNVGKSSIINSLTHQKDLAITSSFPGRTQQVNVFLINESIYLMDLPGYGFAKASLADRARIQQIIYWYLLESEHDPRLIVFIIDASVGPTENDLDMLHRLRANGKNIVIVANKIDKLKKSSQRNELQKIEAQVGGVRIIPFSVKDKIGIQELTNEIFSEL